MILVKVQDKETQFTSIITYKAFHDVKYRFDLIGEVDSAGNLIPGSPNLQPQDRGAAPSVSVIADSKPPIVTTNEPGPIQMEPEDGDDNIQAESAGDTESAPVKVRQKPGPKPKIKESI
jgi:hypothetical protein